MKRSKQLFAIGLFVVLAALLAVGSVFAAPVNGAVVVRDSGIIVQEFNHFDTHFFFEERFRLVSVDASNVSNYALQVEQTFELSDVNTGEVFLFDISRSVQHGTLVNGELRQSTFISYSTAGSNTTFTVVQELKIYGNSELKVEHLWVNGEMVF